MGNAARMSNSFYGALDLITESLRIKGSRLELTVRYCFTNGQ